MPASLPCRHRKLRKVDYPHDKRRCGKTRIAATSKLQEVLLVVKVQMDDAVVVSLLTPVHNARPLGILIKVEEEVMTD